MIDLLSKYSATEIIIFIIMLLIACKEVWQLLEFFYKKVRGHFDSEYGKDKEREEILNKVNLLEENLSQNNTNLLEVIEQIRSIEGKFVSHTQSQTDILNMLIESDKALTRVYIVNAHNEYTQRGSISYYELDSIEKIYTQYKAEGGNSYVEDLMKDIKSLPVRIPNGR